MSSPERSRDPRNRKREVSPVVSVCAPVVFLCLIVCIWWLATTNNHIEQWRLPSPGHVVDRSIDLLSQGWLWKRLGTTALEALLGSIVGALFALPMAWIIHDFPVIRAAVEPFLGATQAIPAIALAPLLALWLGYGLAPIIVLCALIVFFPILVSTVVGLNHLDVSVMEAAHLDGASGWNMIWMIEAPMASPQILSGLRNGFTLSVTGAVVGEMVMGGQGMGQVLVQQRQNIDTAGMFVSIILLCLLAMGIYGVIYRFEHYLKERK